MTFSIVARCARTGMLGTAVATAVPAVGSMCSYVKAGVGAVSTQSWVNPYLAIDALRLMAQGCSAPAALDRVLQADAGREMRQVGLIDAQGRAAAWTGRECTEWCGQIVEPDFAIQGNMLVSAATLEEMARTFRESAACELPERLLRALEAADAAGGDKRGRQSAALQVHHTEEFALLDLRVDEHPRPVTELRRVYEIARLQLLPFVHGMPTRKDPGAKAPPTVVALLADPPPMRPGGGGSATHDTSVEAPCAGRFGLELSPERMREVLAAYAEVEAEIAKLRHQDFGEVHPAVVFEPTAAYRNPR